MIPLITPSSAMVALDLRGGRDDFDQLAHVPPTLFHDRLHLLGRPQHQRARLVLPRQHSPSLVIRPFQQSELAEPHESAVCRGHALPLHHQIRANQLLIKISDASNFTAISLLISRSPLSLAVLPSWL